jgi:hypothetical protein
MDEALAGSGGRDQAAARRLRQWSIQAGTVSAGMGRAK